MSRKILVVEDDKTIQEAIRFVLMDEGYEVDIADHGQQAMSMLESELGPDLIILDIMMPVMDGYQFRQVQLKNPRFCNIPTIALSADRSFHLRTDHKFDGVLKKPVELDDLLSVIERAFT